MASNPRGVSALGQQAPYPTCDLCHKRKVRCDKKDPCGNCEDARVSCHRSRNKKSSQRQRISKSKQTNNHSSHQDHMPRSESTVDPSIPHAIPQSTPQPLPVIQNEQPQDTRNLLAPEAESSEIDIEAGEPSPTIIDPWRNDERRNEVMPGAPSLPKWPKTAVCGPTRAVEGYEIIAHELQFRENLSAQKRQVLESAVSFISQLPQRARVSPMPANRNSRDKTISDISVPSTELLCWMLHDIETLFAGSYVSDYFKHVSLKTLKKMGRALLREELSEDDFLLYSICVNSTAMKFINTIISTGGCSRMEDEMRELAEKHCASALAASEQIHLLAESSLALLQALICSAFVNQRSGNMKLCWTLTARACQVCMDLGLHSMFTIDPSRTLDEEETEAYYCFAWCYMLDKNFATSMRGPPSLTDLNLAVGADPSPKHNQPMSVLLSTYFELARCQDLYVSYIRPGKLPGEARGLRHSQIVNNFLTRMKYTKCCINELRASTLEWQGLHHDSEMHALDFAYNSVMTTALWSVDFSSTDTRHIEEDFLQASRQSLLSLHAMQQTSPCLRNKTTNVAFVNWTLLYYPLTAFFALFCNVVVTSHRNDFTLMKLISDALAENSDLSSSASELTIFLGTFVSLVEHLVYRVDIYSGIGNPNVGRLDMVSFNRENHSESHQPCNSADSNTPLPYTEMQTTNDEEDFLLDAHANFPMDKDGPPWSSLQPPFDWLEGDILPL